MDPVEIKEIETVLSLEEGHKVVSYSTERLTAPGENYGSLMLSLTILVENPESRQEQVNTVAKLIPPNEFLQKIFNTQNTFRNEIAFYKNIMPTLQRFQQEQGIQEVIDFAPKFFGGRINLSGDSVDSDAIIILENLKTSGFVNFERTEGFNLDAAELIIKDLAYLHGVPLALKLQKPEVFETEVRPYLTSELKPPSGGGPDLNKLEEAVRASDGCKPFVGRVMTIMKKGMVWAQPREPFATINHNDVWVNNTMLKVSRGKPIKNKLVDFQICTYGSPAKDVLFFLFSSVKSQILESKYDYLVRLYHKTLVSILVELGCDPTPFSFGAFEKELELESEQQFEHVIFMTFPIFAKKGTVKDIADFQPENMMENGATELQKKKISFVVKEFIKRNWI